MMTTGSISGVIQTLAPYQDATLPFRMNEQKRNPERIFPPGLFDELKNLAPREQQLKLTSALHDEHFSNTPIYQRIEEMYRLSVRLSATAGYGFKDKKMLAAFHRADIELGLIKDK